MNQKIAIEAICKTIIGDKNVEAIFVQGELAEEYFDEHSIIDLYLVVERSKMDYVLDMRYEYLESYKQIIHHFFVFFSCPQIVAIYEDGLRINLYISTLENLQVYGKMVIIYDPKNVLDNFPCKNYSLLPKEAGEYFNTFNYTLLDFISAYLRNDIPYAFRLASHLFSDISTIFRIISDPNNAKLGLKGLYKVLDRDLKEKIYEIMKEFSYDNLLQTVLLMVSIIDSLIMRMPLEIAQYINYDFHVICKKKLLSIV